MHPKRAWEHFSRWETMHKPGKRLDNQAVLLLSGPLPYNLIRRPAELALELLRGNMSIMPSFLLALLSVAVVAASGAGKEETRQELGLRGSWVETFEYRRGPYSAPRVYFDVVGYEPPAEFKTITLSFAETSFIMRFEPPEYSLHDSEPRNSVSGEYSTSGNDLLLKRRAAAEWDRYKFRVEADSLWISASFVAVDSNLIAAPVSSWLWVNSMGKNAGAFARLPGD